MKRKNHVNITIGKRGSGKTFRTLSLLKKHPLKVLIIDTIDHEDYRIFKAITPEMLPAWKNGIVRIYGHDFKEIFHHLNTSVFNALVIFEDCTKYIRWNVPDDLRQFIVDTKQKNIDLIFQYHAFGMVQPDMFRLSDSITIFKTNEDIKTYKNKIPNFPAVLDAWKKVNASKKPYENISVKTN